MTMRLLIRAAENTPHSPDQIPTPRPPKSVSHLILKKNLGAGEGNRTLLASLEG